MLERLLRKPLTLHFAEDQGEFFNTAEARNDHGIGLGLCQKGLAIKVMFPQESFKCLAFFSSSSCGMGDVSQMCG